jgi:hypothetical protein
MKTAKSQVTNIITKFAAKVKASKLSPKRENLANKFAKDILDNVLLRQMLVFNMFKAKAKLSHIVSLLETNNLPSDEKSVSETRGKAATTLNQIRQAEWLGGSLVGLRIFVSGKTMEMVDGSLLGHLGSLAMMEEIAIAHELVLSGKVPNNIINPKTNKYDYNLACLLVGSLGFEKFERTTNNVTAIIDRTVRANTKGGKVAARKRVAKRKAEAEALEAKLRKERNARIANKKRAAKVEANKATSKATNKVTKKKASKVTNKATLRPRKSGVARRYAK